MNTPENVSLLAEEIVKLNEQITKEQSILNLLTAERAKLQKSLDIDTYIQECEKLQSVEAVKNLQYNMPMDFVSLVAAQKLPDGVSREIYTYMQYISTHINEPITAEDVIAFSGKSRAYLFKRIKGELKMGIGEYKNKCRLREAKSLLRYTNKPISEISNYICFSSQSHFQNAFKAKYGTTPHSYRQNTNASFNK